MKSREESGVAGQGKVLEFRTTYTARLEQLLASGLLFKTAGTLDGCIDLAVVEGDGAHRTYSISCDEAEQLATALATVVADVRKNCLHERDAMLMKCAT